VTDKGRNVDGASAITFATFLCTTKIIAGLGALSAIDSELHRIGLRRVAVVADRGISDIGLLAKVIAQVADDRIGRVTLIDPNPDIAAVDAASELVIQAGCDGVLAVGGGSALSAAKAVAIRMTNSRPFTDYEDKDRLESRPAPTLAVPTTAGSGGEVSNALVLHEGGRRRELVIRGAGYEPAVAILDATVLRDLPRAPMLDAAMDALSHALESLWAKGRSSFTVACAEAAAETIFDKLPSALKAPEDELLQQLLEASCLANLACGSSGLGLVHALSSSPAVRLSHGYQNAALLLHVAQFNVPALSDKHRTYVDRLGWLYDTLGLPGGFLPGEIGPSLTEAMLSASRGHPFRVNNARPSTDADVLGILRQAGALTRAGVLTGEDRS
jgi:alcohol dehydrogenase class IV